jgi:TIR domain/Sel1 repeat
MLEPIGFWSYARHDDDNSDGDLSKLRVIFGKQLKLLYGFDVKVWQDVSAIDYGADWFSKINEALNRATFFVPIITPRLLKSEWCMKELRIFIERERLLNRTDLIFPIYYIDIEDVRDDECHDAEMLNILRTRQFADFRDHRRSMDPGGREVRLWLEDMAGSVRRTLRQPAQRVEVVPQARPTISHQHVDVGDDTAPPGLDEEQLAWWQDAHAGEANAQYSLGVMYSRGDGVEQDFAKGAAWYSKAAAQGHPGANCNMGICYNFGRGVPKDDALANDFYRRAAEAGHETAAFNLALSYYNGEGLAQDFGQAIRWFKVAAEAENAAAQRMLGLIYSQEQGVETGG